MWYLCYFLHRLLDYRLPEVEALAKLFGNDELGGEVQWRQSPSLHADSPFYYVQLPSEEVARKVACRSLLVKGIFEVWGEGCSLEELRSSIEGYPEERKSPYLCEGSTFKIIVDCFGKALSTKDQKERIDGCSFIPFKGQVQLKNPQNKFRLIETDMQPEGNGLGTHNGLPPSTTKVFYFGREIGGADRSLVPKYELSSRRYLGPTAMDAEMAMLMANQALVEAGKLVYDPFVGTGSILVAAAHYGATTMGADIDIRVVRDGRGPDCNVWSNFKQYNLPSPVGLVRADNNLPPWRRNLSEIFDAIICDPPYGVRAGGRKSGGRKMLNKTKDPYTIPDEKRAGHIPSTAPYTLPECVHDLLDMAARLLVKGGRLVFFFPAARDECSVDFFPTHPCFRLAASSEQILSTRYSRCLLTMEKIGEYTKEIAEDALKRHVEFKENHPTFLEAHRDRGSIHAVVLPPEHANGSANCTHCKADLVTGRNPDSSVPGAMASDLDPLLHSALKIQQCDCETPGRPPLSVTPPDLLDTRPKYRGKNRQPEVVSSYLRFCSRVRLHARMIEV